MRPDSSFWAVLIFAASAFGLGADALDSTFRPFQLPIARGPDGPVIAMVSPSGGAVIIAGRFERVNGVRRQGIAQLKLDGTLDPGWDAGTGPDGPIRTLTTGTEGTVVVGGEFSNWGGQPASEHAVRLKPDGSIDNSFNAGPAWDGEVIQVLALEGGNTLVLGRQWQVGELRPLLRRLQIVNGPDPSFAREVPAGASLNAMALAADGSVLLVGRFQEFGGLALTNLVRLRSDGTIDAAFRPPAAAMAGEWYCVAVAGDGRIALGGVVTNAFPEGALVV
jgi:Domain of unknown function (DUF5122) beta-propeller